MTRDLPTPGAATILHIETLLTFPDGTTHTSESSARWDGYTVADVIANRTNRWRDAGQKFERHGDGLVIELNQGDYRTRETMRLEAYEQPTLTTDPNGDTHNER